MQQKQENKKNMRLPFNIQPKRTALQENAIKVAKQIYESDPEKYKDTMFCPYCGQPLIKSVNQRRMQTLSEHVSDPNGVASLKDEYICSAKGLFEKRYLFDGEPDSQIGCEFGILHSWNGGWEKGYSYASDYWHKLYDLSKESIINKRVVDQYFHEDYIHEFKNALNTDNCEYSVIIYNTGLPRFYRLPSWLTFNFIQLIIEMSYKANSFGEVTGTYAKLGFLKKDDNIGSFCIHGSWFWSTWRFLNQETKGKLRSIDKINDEKEKAKIVANAMNISGNDAWIYRLHQWYEYLIHPKYARLLKKYKMYKKSTWQID